MRSLRIRAAAKEDCPALAQLVMVAHWGLLQEFYKGLIPDMSPEEIVKKALEDDSSPFSYKSCRLAESNGEPLGMMMGFPSTDFFRYEDLLARLPRERVEPFREVFQPLPEDSYYAYALAAFPGAAGRWAGPKLVSDFIQGVWERGYQRFFFHTWADNDRAVQFYCKRYGAQVIKAIDIPPTSWLPAEKKQSLLMCLER